MSILALRCGLAAVLAGVLLAGSAQAQAPEASSSDWRTVAPEDLVVMDTSKGRILIELSPIAAPNHAARIRTLAGRGFYDGLKFHRVLSGFMAQTGDPDGTGAGASDLPDVAGEFSFRRGADAGFVAVPNAGAGVNGLVGTLPVATQPDAQMMVTADFKVGASGLFCPGVVGMARSQSPDSANSQFFLMMGRADALNTLYTAFGRVLGGMDVVRALKAGPPAEDGAVTDPDIMTRVRMASDLPAAQRPTVRVLDPRSPRMTAVVEQARAARGAAFNICDVDLPVEVAG